jgi:hypothetical protein
MPLLIRLERDLFVPVIRCDYCGAEIREAGQGNYQWRTLPAREGIEREIRFTHNACCGPFRRQHRGELWGAINLNCLLVYLGNNLNVNWTEAKKTTAFLDSFS